ncbi:MAG: DUF11 domain-containing protein [Pirellulales bacterium]|nr:DUF11 domain-containing protein [Pirellulales bacterium]
MKRLIIRISALAVVSAIGWIAIAQAQRGDDQSAADEPKVETVVTDTVTEKQNEGKKASNEVLPPQPLPAKSLSESAAVKSVLAVKNPPPLLTSAGSGQHSDPNPLREVGMPEPSATSSVVLSSASVKPSSNDQRDKTDPGRTDQIVMPSNTNTIPPVDRIKPQISSPGISAAPALAAPRTLGSDQVAAAPLETANRAAEKTISAKQGIAAARGENSLLGSRYSSKPGQLASRPPVAPSVGGVQKPTPLQSNNMPQMLRAPVSDTLANGPGLSATGPGASAGATSIIAEGTGTPARDRSLDGSQSPQLSIEKLAPPEIQVGSPATFRVVVRNTGTITASGVEIRDQVPKGTRLMATTPRASRNARGEVVWILGDMKPGDEKTVETKLMPLSEGEIGSVATVHFNASASVRTRATKPELVVQTTMPRSVTIGEEVSLKITVSNPGSGVARGVVLQEQVPNGLQHPAGAELEYEIGDLKPNQSRTLELKLIAARPGKVTNILIARGKSGLQTTEEQPLEVIAPQLQLAISGPKRRFLERQTTYKLSVSNPGTAPARDVKLQAKLPEGMRFIKANNNGHYDAQTKTVSWALAELPVNETGSVILTAMPEVIGEQKLTYRGTAEGALSVEEQKEIIVDGISAISFEVADVEDPVELGGETLYEIRVVNQGSKASNNVCLEVTLPPSMQLIDAKGPADIRSNVSGNRISFEPIRRLSPKVDTTYQVRVKCGQAGDQRVRVQLKTDDMQTPVTKEESTKVFSDN